MEMSKLDSERLINSGALEKHRFRPSEQIRRTYLLASGTKQRVRAVCCCPNVMWCGVGVGNVTGVFRDTY